MLLSRAKLSPTERKSCVELHVLHVTHALQSDEEPHEELHPPQSLVVALTVPQPPELQPSAEIILVETSMTHKKDFISCFI
jgi:hypothetical protein